MEFGDHAATIVVQSNFRQQIQRLADVFSRQLSGLYMRLSESKLANAAKLYNFHPSSAHSEGSPHFIRAGSDIMKMDDAEAAFRALYPAR
jgi:hypothetical protein